jgi:1,4-dihydroxy-2-naphthoate polyprenyltransferase
VLSPRTKVVSACCLRWPRWSAACSSTNLANDYYDHKKGADGADRLGPARAAQMGWITPRDLLIGTGLCLGLALLVGVYLIAVGGWPILVLGALSLLLAVGYTGGPYPLAYHGLGDLFVLLFFGYGAVCGTTWVQTGTISLTGLLAATAVGLLATGILVVNNLRDRLGDNRANKRTLAVRFGARAARLEYTACVGLAFLMPVLGLLAGEGSALWLLPWLALPLGIGAVRAIWTTDGAALNPWLGKTARLELVFGLLFALALVLSRPG